MYKPYILDEYLDRPDETLPNPELCRIVGECKGCLASQVKDDAVFPWPTKQSFNCVAASRIDNCVFAYASTPHIHL